MIITFSGNRIFHSQKVIRFLHNLSAIFDVSDQSFLKRNQNKEAILTTQTMYLNNSLK